MYVKKIGFVCVFVLLCSLSVSAQGTGKPGQYDWWYTLERGKLMFRQGDYGNALLAFDDARRQRRAMYEQMERDFIDLLSIREVRRIGDSLEYVERYIQNRRYDSAADALRELYYRIPKESLNDSAQAALTALGTLKDYPEAEQWIGETYLMEGEFGLALSQFQKALDMRHLYETPGHAVELLYKIAEIRRTRQEYNEMERILLSIIEADSLWSGNAPSEPQPDGTARTERSISFARQAMTRILENNGINRFLTLYRYSNAESLEAHRLLGLYYYVSGRHAKAEEHLMFAFLIQNTVIIDEITRHQYDFTFTTLETLAPEIDRSRLLSEYAEKNEYHKIAYYLGASLYGNGKAETARGIWDSLAVQNQAGEWQRRSITQLRAPYVERAIEMP